MTAKTTAKATKTTKATKDATVEATNTVTDGAREFVKRTAETAQERAETLFENSKSYNAQMEDTLKRAASGYANILGSFAQAAFANVNHTLAAVEKLAEAKSASEAMQIQADFVREHTNQNMGHVRSAYDYVREAATDGSNALRDNYAKMWQPTDKKAA